MSYTTKSLPNSQIEFTITVTQDDYKGAMEKAALKISERTKIKGFRPGKAPYDLVKKEVGEAVILQEAADEIVKNTFFDAMKKEELETIGMPQINVEKMAPGNDFVYKAVVALLPKVKLPDLSKIKIKHEVKPVDENKITETLDAIRGMHAKEVEKEGPATGTDKLILDMDMFLDKVPVDGGQAKNHQVYLSEKHYIPGFNEQVEGMKKGDEKEFSLNFPENHYQKHLAGKKVDFKIKIKEVYERQLPEMNDELAKKIGQESVDKLKAIISNNLLQEAKQKEDQRVEIDMLEQLIKESEFDDLPEILIDSERQKMFYELKNDLDRHGVPIEKYLEDIKKDEKALFEEFREQATKRAKAALISRQVAMENDIKVTPEEIDAEIKMMEGFYKDQPDYIENLEKPEVRESIAVHLQNRKVVEWLKDKIVDKKAVEASDATKA